MKITTLKFLLLIINVLFIHLLSAYSQGFTASKELFLEAESYFIHEEFSDALPIYIQLKEKYPNNYNLDYRIGRCYLYMPYEKTKSVSFLETAIKHISPEYKEGKFNEMGAPNDAIFYLADAYRVNNQLDKAIATYNNFKNLVKNTNYDIELIDDQITACKRALEAKKKPLDIEELNLGAPVNTRYAETNPVVSPNEDIIIYAARLPFYQAMFYSKKVNDKWIQPVNMIPDLGVDGDCFPVCLSYDGTELYVYRSDEYRGDLYVTNFINNKWSKLRKLNPNINTKFWESHACISADGKTLYFTSNREGGYGGLDIYKSHRGPDGVWGPAINLGPEVNSKYNEETPYIMPDGKRLYFSSFGHESIGGYDVFYSNLNNNGIWTKPKNLGYPINTTDDDLFFYPLQDGSTAYTSVFDPNGQGRYDIVRIKYYTYENPRKYVIAGNAHLKVSTGTTPVYHLALIDKTKNDTVLRKTFTDHNISFEAVPGKYEVVLVSDNDQMQKQPLTIAWGSKEIIRSMDFTLSPVEKNISENIATNLVSGNIVSSDNTKPSGANNHSGTDQKDTQLALNTFDNKKEAPGSSQNSVTNQDSANPATAAPQISSDSILQEPGTDNKNLSDVNGKWQGFNWKYASLIALPIIILIGLFLKRRKKKEN